MTKIKIKKIIWDDYNVEHIKKHNVSVGEVETAAKNVAWHKNPGVNRQKVLVI